MACGTPVIAFRNGSVPEVVDDGVTGFIVDNEDEAVAATQHLKSLDRARIRGVFERRFTARRMAEDYLKIFRELVARHRPLQEAV
jgi:glycosyltransferase involved in cell wall biosynthesis